MGNLPNIFQAKAYAIGRRVQFNIDKNYQNPLIAFLSVSQAAIPTLSSDIINSKTAWPALGKLNNLRRNNKVTAGHAGLHGIEEADILARNGISSSFVGPEPFCGL